MAWPGPFGGSPDGGLGGLLGRGAPGLELVVVQARSRLAGSPGAAVVRGTLVLGRPGPGGSGSEGAAAAASRRRLPAAGSSVGSAEPGRLDPTALDVTVPRVDGAAAVGWWLDFGCPVLVSVDDDVLLGGPGTRSTEVDRADRRALEPPADLDLAATLLARDLAADRLVLAAEARERCRADARRHRAVRAARRA